MNVVVATDRRFFLDTAGTACCTDGSKGYSFWTRYLDKFETVTIVARLAQKTTTTGTLVEGPGVSLLPLIDYTGPRGYLLIRKQLVQQLTLASTADSSFILRVPGQIGALLQDCLHRKSRPYGVEVIADPYDLFARGACEHPLRRLIRWSYCRRLRRLCKHASAASYVTKYALQDRYPPNSAAMAIDYSSVEMPDDAYVSVSRSPQEFSNPKNILFIGSMTQLYKGVHFLIDAFTLCLERNNDLHLTIVGEGKYQRQMESRCRARNVSDRVTFLGRLRAGAPVREQLDRADLFVLPSLTEGLPRAVIEAMGRGLPCIATNVGGIPELLPQDDLAPAGEVNRLADKMLAMLNDPQRMAHSSKRNLVAARRYHADNLTLRRQAFYGYLRSYTVAAASKHAG